MLALALVLMVGGCFVTSSDNLEGENKGKGTCTIIATTSSSMSTIAGIAATGINGSELSRTKDAKRAHVPFWALSVCYTASFVCLVSTLVGFFGATQVEIPVEDHLHLPASRGNMSQTAKVPLCYFLPYGNNFGDDLGVHIFRRLAATRLPCSVEVLPYDIARETGGKVGNMERPKSCVMGLGSILHMLRPGDRWQVWGTGANRHYGGVTVCPEQVAAVRGPRTGKQIQDKCGPRDSPIIPFGDPGIFASEGTSMVSCC